MAVDAPAVVEIDLTRGAPEVQQSTLFGPTREGTHLDLVRTLRQVAESEATKGVLVRLGTARFSFAGGHEIGRMLGKLRDKNIPVVCHSDDYNNGSLLLASVGCSRLWLSAAGSVDAVSLAAQLLYGNKLLTRLHVGVDFLQVGKYKGAEEPFTRDGPSPEARESLETALGGLRRAWLDGITKGRGRPGVEDAAEDGPFPANDAKANGLIDEVGYLDDARDDAKRLAGVTATTVRFGSGSAGSASKGLLEVLRAISGASAGGTPHVAVVRAIGSISMAPSGMFGQGGGITERELSRVIDKLAKDESVHAVVLRIDSPGGSALASDLLWKRLMILRAKKPLVVSVGGMAASGGYYLSCAGTKIVAEPSSIIGSIGVVGGKFSLGKTLEEIGIHAETVAATKDPAKAARAAWLSPFEPWDDATRARMLASMTSIYDLFLQRISEGRGVPIEKIAPSAEGRLFGGVDAKERGLVDELGGLDDATRMALELAKLPADGPVEVIGDAPGLLELLEAGDSAESSAAVREAAMRDAARVVAPSWLDGMPEVASFVGSAAPLLRGERTLTALPFVILLR
jgi:protease IV